MVIMRRSITGAERLCRVGDCEYGGDHLMIRVVVVLNWGITGAVTVVIDGRDYVDAVWVRGADSNSTLVGDGCGDGEEGWMRN